MTQHATTVDSFVDYVRTRDWVSFVELRQFLEGHGVETAGDISFEVVPNGVIWAGMSEEFADIVRALQADGRLILDGGNVLAYYVDGGALNLPVAKREPRDISKGYAKPYWLPSFFRPREASNA